MQKERTMNDEIEDLLAAIDILWKNFNNCKSHFPYMKKEAKGAKEVKTALYYINQGFDVRFVFSEGISEEGIKKINEVGHWINQNVIIRLCAILESYHIISNTTEINFDLEGAEQVNISRRLRNCFTHSSGRYKADNKEHRKTLKLMKDHLGISIDECKDWPLSIDTVIQPLFEGCSKYVREKAEK